MSVYKTITFICLINRHFCDLSDVNVTSVNMTLELYRSTLEVNGEPAGSAQVYYDCAVIHTFGTVYGLRIYVTVIEPGKLHQI